MPAFNNGFPATYPGAQYYNPYQYQQQAQQQMTPPTIHAEIVQVDNEAAAANYPVGAGASQMMIARDDSAIFIKTATANGCTLTVYTRRPQETPSTQTDYITRKEFEERIAALCAPQKGEQGNEPV